MEQTALQRTERENRQGKFKYSQILNAYIVWLRLQSVLVSKWASRRRVVENSVIGSSQQQQCQRSWNLEITQRYGLYELESSKALARNSNGPKRIELLA